MYGTLNGVYRMKEGKMHIYTFDTHSNGDIDGDWYHRHHRGQGVLYGVSGKLAFIQHEPMR